MIYAYPAVFEFDKTDGAYNVDFPDLKGCFTCGWTIKEACEMAQDVLNLWLWDMEYDDKPIPEPSDIKNLEAPEHGFLSYVLADTEAYTPIMIKNNPNMKIDVSRIKKEQRSA